MVMGIVPLASFVLCLLAEALHARRARRVVYLAFGPQARPRPWTTAMPVVRAVAVAAVCWGLLVLWQNDTSPPAAGSRADASPISQNHLVIALDVSPSMLLSDAGPKGDQPRADRAREVLRSLLERIDVARSRVSVLAFYTEARPVVVDTFDPEVVTNILDDLPLEHAFEAGKTQMYSAVEMSAKLAQSQQWRDRSVHLVLVSDGDTLPAQRAVALPPAFASVLVAGVGDPHRGMFIDGHSSRQDAGSLQRLALQLGGSYHDANGRHLPSDALRSLTAAVPGQRAVAWGSTERATAAVIAGSAILALLPIALTLFGSSWNPQRAAPIDAMVKPDHANTVLRLT